MPTIESILTDYGLLAVVIWTFVEGETCVIVAGFLAHQGYFSPYLLALAAFTAAAAPALARAPYGSPHGGNAAFEEARSEAKEQTAFGIKVAQNGLWKEAAYRWERAVQIDPTYAAAWNNLAIAYEHEGKFEEARKAYERALELDPKNLLIRQNYDLFKEINDRTQKRRSDR